jgi:hypothetical protein
MGQVVNVYFGPVDMSEHFENLTHLRYNVNLYEHEALVHTLQQFEQYRPVSKLGSWVCESANAFWKFTLLHLTTQNTGNENLQDTDIAKQALKTFIQLTHPVTRRGSVKGLRLRNVYICGDCGLEKMEGHTRICTFKAEARTTPSTFVELQSIPGVWVPGILGSSQPQPQQQLPTRCPRQLHQPLPQGHAPSPSKRTVQVIKNRTQ